MSATIHVTGTLSLLLLLLSRGAAMEQEPIQIYYGTDDEREIYNETTINVTDTGSLLRLKFVANQLRIGELRSETSTLSTSYETVIHHRSSITEPLTDTHLLQVTGSGSMMVQGLLYSSGNFNYTIILYFDVRSDPTEVLTTTTAATTTTEPFTTTKGEQTTSHAVSTAATVQIQKSTFVPVVVVVIVVALVLCTATILAIATAIHYRKRLKDLQLQSAAT